ncbi:LPS export ABC transporter permease LptF [Komagataeibacter sucrofermentans]|uniref:LPS export ABC transporter permease LptF n=1 Tax=Komagataeibacter sucrofermentans TaxID=1053551 RepID=A0A318QTU6_9PROT|nr:LPS export ABC transporter permease LptF [Komagataeibacter sucrofermentans]PYD80821.1 LPS export ABC transporter permease LptF [Komagataeibacter sucrofermentans]GBQ50010.1 transporter YjgP/YjgQ [Komagataeibacter sucrofermentans DSM 15973]
MTALRPGPDRLAPRLSILDRYMLRQLLLALAASTGALATLIWLTQSLHFVSLVVGRGLSLRVFLELTSLLIPSFVAVILPITTFVVVQFIYQRFGTDRELTVMQAAGLSPFMMARPGLICAAIATGACLLLNVWVVPVSYHAFRQYEFQIRNRMAAFLIQDGVFTQVSDSMTVYIRARDKDGTLHGIMVEDDRTPGAEATILAEEGNLVIVGDQPRVVLFNGSRQEIDAHTGRLNVLTFARNTIDLSSPHGNHTRQPDANELPIAQLLHPDMHLYSRRDESKMVIEAWRRLSTPFCAFSFAMIGLLGAMGGNYSRQASIIRPVLAILGVVAVQALTLAVQNLASRNLQLMPLMWICTLTPGLICAALLFWPEFRADREKPAPAGNPRP